MPNLPCLEEVFETWACRSRNENFGGFDAYGCQVGCLVLLDGPPENLVGRCQAQRSGERWLLPHSSFQSRDASGMFHDLRTGRPHRVYPTMYYEVAPCFSMPGKECHGADYCECYPPESRTPTGSGVNRRCECGEGIGALLIGMHRDCTTFIGSTWPLHGPSLRCRRSHEGGPVTIQLDSNRLLQGMFVSMGDFPMSNPLPIFVGRVPPSACRSSYYHVRDNLPGAPPPLYYDEGPCRQAKWARTYLWGRDLPEHCNPQIKVNSAKFPNADRRVVDAKNLALHKLVMDPITFPGNVRFDQLDSYAIVQNTNDQADIWEREWSGTDRPIAQLPIVLSMPNCKLKNAACPVAVDLVFEYVKISMSLVAHVELQDQGVAKTTERRNRPLWLLPSARMMIQARLSLRASALGVCKLIRPWMTPPFDAIDLSLGVRRLPSGQRLPIVQPDGHDHIVYIHPSDGRPWDPPLDVRWMGMQGPFSNPPWQDVFMDPQTGNGLRRPGEQVTTISQQSALFADSLSFENRQGTYKGVKPTGWPWFAESQPNSPSELYIGGVGCRFPQGRCN